MPLSSKWALHSLSVGVRISGMSYHMHMRTVLIHLIRWLISLHYITLSKHSEVHTTKDLSSCSSSSSWSWSSRRMLTKQHRNKVANIVGDLSIPRSWFSFPLICSLSYEYVYPVNPFKWENYVNRKIRKIIKRKAAKNQFQFSFSRWLRKFIEL